MKKEKKINLGFHHLVVHNVELEVWCSNYGLRIFTAPCMDCGRSLTANIPIVGKNRRGLRSEPCKCGNHDVPFTYIDTNYDEINLNTLLIENNEVK